MLRGIACITLAACSFKPGFVVKDDGGEVDGPIDAPPDADTPRVEDSILAQWRCADGSGSSVSASVGGLPLTISPTSLVTWSTGGLHIDGPSQIKSGDARALINLIKKSPGVTIEAWLTADNDTQGAAQYAAAVTLSTSINVRDATIQQQGNTWVGRIRTTDPMVDKNGQPAITGPAVTPGSPQHLALVADPSQRMLYVDGTAYMTTPPDPGAVSTWDNTMRVLLGDELNSGAAHMWNGTIWLVTIYGRALSSDEIQKNFLAGYDCPSC